MVQAFAPDGTNDAFDITVLPWGSRCGRTISNAHCPKPPGEHLAIGTLIVANEKDWSGTPGKGFG